MKSEEQQIFAHYAERKSIDPLFYSYFNPGNLFIVQSRERVLLKLMRQGGITQLADLRILDIGCGTAGELRKFVNYGALPENLYGIDLIPERVAEARRLSPGFQLQVGNARQLPYDDGFFDGMLQFVAFSSNSPEARKDVAREMLRVLKPGGFILWYDFFAPNPLNKHVTPVGKKEIYSLFGQHCKIRLERNTLVAPLVRRLARSSWMSCIVLERIPFLNTHYVGFFKKH